MRLLVVEDDPTDVLLVRRALARAGVDVEVVVAQDGLIAREMLMGPDPIEPDLILLDLNLPGLSGLELLDELKQTPGLRRIPVVVLSTSNDSLDVVAAYDRHANSYVVKPHEFGVFVEFMRTIRHYWGDITIKL